jgi:hypothetical protein
VQHQTIIFWVIAAAATGFIAYNQGRRAYPWVMASLLFSAPLTALALFVVPVKPEHRARRRNGAGLLNALAVAAVLAAMVGLIHSAEAASVSQTIGSILSERFEGKNTKPASVSYPFYFSIPLLAAWDVIPGTVEGTFEIERPEGSDQCRFEVYRFELRADAHFGYVVSIPGIEMDRIGQCLSAAT